MSEEKLNEKAAPKEPEEEFVTLTGKVVFKLSNVASKSESLQPYLVGENEKEIHIFLKDSNPFENNQLKDLEDKTIKAEGIIKDNTFIIHEIKTDIEGLN